MHLLRDGMVAIPMESHLHPELRQHLPALRQMARVLVDKDHDPHALAGTVLDHPEHRAAYDWLALSMITERAFGIPLFSPAYCDSLIVEAELMAETVGYTPNPDEELAYQIPELVLEQVCPQLFIAMKALKESTIDLFTTILFGQPARLLNTVQFARYTDAATSHGNWHADIDSDVTAVVSLAPERFTGGGTEVRAWGRVVEYIPPLDKGHCLLFHGKTTLHRGCKVNKGVRDLLVFWSEYDKE